MKWQPIAVCFLIIAVNGISILYVNEEKKALKAIRSKLMHILDINTDLKELVDNIKLRDKLRSQEYYDGYHSKHDQYHFEIQDDLLFVSDLVDIKSTHIKTTVTDILSLVES